MGISAAQIAPPSPTDSRRFVVPIESWRHLGATPSSRYAAPEFGRTPTMSAFSRDGPIKAKLITTT